VVLVNNHSQQSTVLPESSKAESQKETAAPQQGDEQHSNGNGRMKASPLAKKLAKEKGIDLKAVHGSGDGGRIVKADVDSFSPQTTVDRPPSKTASPATSSQQPVTEFFPTLKRNLLILRIVKCGKQLPVVWVKACLLLRIFILPWRSTWIMRYQPVHR
jgi:pyruvate/2-oxoglutarate dehydrogenase complex dihydrolipoamide acyltransferase (E2) component